MADVAAAAVAPSAPASPSKATPKLEGSALQDALRTQLEFYFSKANLATDSYLLSQMNAHPSRSVPVDVICGFRKIQSLSTNKDEIIAAMKLCKNLTLDAQQQSVRSNIKQERTTLILRDLPATADAAALRAVFEDRADCPAKGHIVSLTAETNDTWYLIFDSEAACMDTAQDMQAHAYTPKEYKFNGQAVNARVKNESINRGFYTAPANNNGANNNGGAPVHSGSGSSILVGGPVSPAGAVGAPLYNPYQQYPYGGYYPQQFMPMGAAVAHPMYFPGQAGMPLVTPLAQPQQPAAGAAPLTKAEKKAAAAAALAVTQAAAPKKKKKETVPAAGAAAASAPAAAAPASATPPPAAGADGSAAPKAAKKKKAKDAAAVAGGAPIQVVAAPSAPVSAPLITSVVNLYGNHTPRTYTREQMAHAVDELIKLSKNNPAALKRPDGFEKCHDPEKAVVKEKPSMQFSILEPFPVIYPASPSPLLAAQPHHSGSLPFLELGGSALDTPYFAADSGFAGAQPKNAGAAARRGSKSAEGGKKPAGAAGAAPTNYSNASAAGAKSARSPASKPRPSPATTAAAPQPKIIPPPAVQPPSAVFAAAGPAAPVKPASFAAAALAAANAPQQAPKPAAPKPAAAAAAAKPAAATARPASAAAPAAAGKPKADKKKPAPAAAAAPVAAAAAAPAKPVVPVVNYASRVGSVSPAEAAAKAAAQKAEKAAKEAQAKAEQEAKNPSPAAPAAAAAATPAAAANGAAAKPAATPAKPAAAAAAAPAAEATPAKAAFSYAAMIKKAPATPSPPAASTAATPAKAAAPAAAPAASAAAAPAAAAGAAAAGANNGGVPKSEAGNWRAQQ